MKTIGLLGGMSWESTVTYYQTINRLVGKALGGLHSAPIVLVSVDFAPIETLGREGRWDETGDQLAAAARQLEQAGADSIVMCTNTMHRVAPQIEAAVGIPLLHIVEPTAGAIIDAGISRVGLLGTAFTMEMDFYRGKLASDFDLDVVVPDDSGRQQVHHIIYDELCRGVVSGRSRERMIAVVDELASRGASGVILGCTEIGLLLESDDVSLPLFDTTQLHAAAAARFALDR